MSETKTEFGKDVCLTDFGEPDYLDGAQMQFMVTVEEGFGKCLAYFSVREDAELFARAKAEQLLEDAGL